MKTYIEVVILNNFLVNLMIIYAVTISINLKFNFPRAFLADILGTCFAVLLPFIGEYIIIALKIILSIIMCAIFTKYKNFKQFILSLLLFYGYTFLLGGAVIALIGVNNLKTSFSYISNNSLIPAITGLSGLFLLYMVKQLIKYLKNIKISSTLKVVLKISDKEYPCEAFYDSGNKLYDNYGLPAVVIDKKFANELMNENKLKISDILVKTVTGTEKMSAIEIKEITIIKDDKVDKFKNVTAGISKSNFKKYKILLHSEMC